MAKASASEASSKADALPTSDRVDPPEVSAFETHLATRPRHTRDAYLRDVRKLADAVGETSLTRLTRAQLARHLAQFHARGLSGRSLARMLSAWRAFYDFAIERDRALGDNPCAGLKAPKSAKRLPSALTPDEAVRLVALDDDERWSARDRALLELAYSSGLRLSELASSTSAAWTSPKASCA